MTNVLLTFFREKHSETRDANIRHSKRPHIKQNPDPNCPLMMPGPRGPRPETCGDAYITHSF